MGSVVLFNWQQLLATDAFSVLGIESTVCFEFEDPQPPNPGWDPRAIQGNSDLLLKWHATTQLPNMLTH